MKILHRTNIVDNSRTSIDRLREVVEKAPDEMGSLGSWLATSLEDYFSRASKGFSMEKAFNISCGAGQQPWWSKEQVCKRNEAIIELAQPLNEKNNSKKAKRVNELLLQYLNGRWKHNRMHGIPGNACKNHELFYTILKSGGGKVLCERTIREILKNA